MLAPKRVLHRKVQRGSMKGQAKGNTQLHFGEYGLKGEGCRSLTGGTNKTWGKSLARNLPHAKCD